MKTTRMWDQDEVARSNYQDVSIRQGLLTSGMFCGHGEICSRSWGPKRGPDWTVSKLIVNIRFKDAAAQQHDGTAHWQRHGSET